MKNFRVFFVAALLAVPAITTSSAIEIDGVADTAYGSAISTQALGTAAFDNTETNLAVATGSELDAAYGFVSNGVLYLVIAGNFDSSFVPYDTVHTFFMSDAGQTGNILPPFSDGGFNGRRNQMTGMTFDTGFNPDYWIYMNTGQDGVGSNCTMYVDYVVVTSNGPYAFLGSVLPTNSPPNVLTNVYFGNIMRFALDNSNTGGVTSTTCTTNSLGQLQATKAAAVRSGFEMAIPVATIGSPTGTVRVCSFLTMSEMTYIYNQVLGPFDGGVPYCTDPDNELNGFTTLTSFFDFNAYPGQHYFTITVPPCEVIKVDPTTASYTSTGGVGSVTALNSGGCAITVTASTNWLTVTSTPGLGSGNGSFTYSVASNANTIQTRTGQFFIKNTAPSGSIVTQIVTITQTGIPSPALSTIFEIDGIAEDAYGCPLTVQHLQTQFGNVTTTNANLVITGNGGSELDAAYGMINDGILFLVFAGNLENNGNKLDIFLMTGPGGQNTLSNANPNVGGINNMASSTNGLTFHSGFAPNYLISANVAGGTFYVDYAQLVQGGTNSGAVGYFLGSTTITNGTLIGGTNPFGIQATVNNSNTNGVDGGTCLTNGSSQVQADLAATVRTGIELGIPLSALGSPTGAIAVVVFVNNGNHTYMSNQMLPSLVTNACQGNLGIVGATMTINLTNYAGEASFLVGPEMRVKSISTVATNVVLSYQTAASTNLTYQVQRTSAITNTTWSNVGGLQIGNGGIITITNFNGATNSPAQFYRVRQTPLCP